MEARREPVEITYRGQRDLILMSAIQYDWLTAAIKRSHPTADAPAFVIDAVALSEMKRRSVTRKKSRAIPV